MLFEEITFGTKQTTLRSRLVHVKQNYKSNKKIFVYKIKNMHNVLNFIITRFYIQV